MRKLVSIVSLVLATFSADSLASDFYIGPSLFLQTVSASSSNSFDYVPMLSLGYGGMSGKYSLSGEAFVVPFTGVITNSINHQGTNTKTASGFGASLIPGMQLGNQFVGFLRLGIITMRFPGPNDSTTGGQLGIGLLRPLTKDWDFRLEYIFTEYAAVAGLGMPRTNALGMGVIYHFDGATVWREQTGLT